MKFIIFVFGLVLVMFTVVLADDGINVTIMGWAVAFDGQGAIREDGQILVPVRGVFEHLGFDVYWDSDAARVILSHEDYDRVTITIGSREFTIGDETFLFDVPARIINNRTLVPIRVLMEGLGFNVRFLAAHQELSIEFRPTAD